MKSLVAALLLISSSAFAQQPMVQSGAVTPGHVPVIVTNGVLGDGGTAAQGNLSGIGITASGLSSCINSDLTTAAGWQQMCLGVTTAGGAQITTSNFGTAPAASLTFLINGVAQIIPLVSGSTTVNDAACFNNTSGQLKDCGFAPGNVTGPGSSTATHIATFADTTGRVLSDGGSIGATTLTGDVTGCGIGSFATTIAANAVSNAKFRQSVGLSVVGTAGTATANVADITGTANQVLGVNSAGTALAFGQVNLASTSAVTGQLVAGSFPALTGDITTAGGALATTLATVNSNVGTFGGGANHVSITTDGKGRITAISDVTPALTSFSQIAGQTTLAQLPTIVNNSVLANLSGGSSVPSAQSPSSILDVFSPTQGYILYRDAGAWQALAPGSSGQLLSTGGVAANPSWITASGTGTVTSVGSDGSINTSIASNAPITATGTLSIYGDPGSIYNCTLAATVSGNALTVALKSRSGSDPSTAVPCYISFRNATIATGDYTFVKVAAATSFSTASSGDTFGSSSSMPFRLWITAWNNAGTVVLGVSKQSIATQVYPLNEAAVQSSTACSACGTAATSGVFYTTAAQTSKAIRILGYMDWASGLGTAGVWASGPTSIVLMGPGIKKPGDVVQSVFTAAALTLNISLTASPNLVRFSGSESQGTSGSVLDTVTFKRGSTTLQTQFLFSNTAPAFHAVASAVLLDLPGTTSSTTYSINNSATSNDSANVLLEEIQG